MQQLIGSEQKKNLHGMLPKKNPTTMMTIRARRISAIIQKFEVVVIMEKNISMHRYANLKPLKGEKVITECNND